MARDVALAAVLVAGCADAAPAVADVPDATLDATTLDVDAGPSPSVLAVVASLRETFPDRQRLIAECQAAIDEHRFPDGHIVYDACAVIIAEGP